jgi:hypothetical protein
LFKEAHEYPLPNEISLISLARFAFGEDMPDDAMMVLADWSRSPATMQAAIRVLEGEDVTPEDLLSETFEDAARLVAEHLMG